MRSTPSATPKPAASAFAFRRRSMAIVGLVTLLVAIITLFGLLNGTELRAINLAFLWRGPRPPEHPILIVAIDDYTFSNSRLQWPYPRTLFAQIIDKLAARGARSITFDVFTSEPESPGQPATYVFHEDTLAELAQQYNVSLSDLAQANSDKPEICAGDRLTVPTTQPQTAVVTGDSIEDLAALYQAPLDLLLSINGKTGPCEFRDAEIVLMPILGAVQYTVTEADTLTGVAGKFQINPGAILGSDQNPAHDPLTAGEVLTIQFGDKALAASLAAAGNVILNGGIEVEEANGARTLRLNEPIAPLKRAWAAFGISDIAAASGDGIVHALIAVNQHPAQDNVALYSWPLVTAAYTLDPTFQLEPRWDVVAATRQIALPRGAPIPLNANVEFDGGQMFINFRGGAGTFETVSALKVINGDDDLEPNFTGYRDKIVLIGSTSESLKDTFDTPFEGRAMPGVEVMANALETALTGAYLARLPLPVALVLVGLAGLLALALTTVRQITVAIGMLMSVMIIYALVWLGAFVALRIQMPLVAPELTLAFAFIAPTLERAVSEELEKRRVRGIFEMFISPEMVGQLIEQGVEAMRGKRAELTILFSDIRGFTTLSEKLTPEELVGLLNEYLGVMTDVIHQHGGTVDKYEGDLVMAFFGAPLAHPDHAQRAVRASIEMRAELDRLRQKWAGEGKPSKLEMGIGLNTAEVFVGLVGSGRRVNYTVMGDGVNLASRLQDLTKDLTWPLLIGEATYEKVKDEFDAEFGDTRLVKGKTVPVNIYKVFGEKGAPPEKRVRPLFE